MAIYYGVGGAVVSDEEYVEKLQLGTFTRMTEALSKRSSESFDIGGRMIKAADAFAGPAGNPFTPIEYGKPLAAEIRWVFTGNKPRKTFGDTTKDMLITSAFKSIATYNEAPRAVNLLRQQVKAFSHIQWNAGDKGTPLAFYTPAVAEPATFATFEIIFDNFPDETIKKLGEAVGTAASIPVFAAQNVYLLAASFLLKLVAAAGHSIFDGDVAFSATEQIAFTRPGSDPTPAGWRIMTQEKLDDDFLQKLTVGKEGQLLGSDGKPYNGDHPYVVISLDGRGEDAYKDFTPTAASAALLDRFFAIQDGQMQPVDAVLEGLKLYSDLRFRLQAEKLQKELSKLKPDDPKYAKKKQEFDAVKENILRDELKLPEES
jgi:hypothetical protein